jgi:DNA-binding cell septation regulator SpoVG
MAESKKKIVSKVELRLVNKGNLKASGNMIIGNDWMRVDCTVIEGRDGPFVSLPRYKGKGKDGEEKWYSSVWFINEDARKEVEKTVLDAYAAMLKTAKTAAPTSSLPAKNDIPVAEDNVPF